MATPTWGLKSNDNDGSEIELILLHDLHVKEDDYQYSDEAKAARKAIEAAMKRRKVPRPVAPEWPSRYVDGRPLTDDEWVPVKAAFDEARETFNTQAKAFNAMLATVAPAIEKKARKAFDARVAAKPARFVRIGNGWSGNPIMAGNLARRFRLLTETDNRALDRLDKRIAALQADRARLLADAWERGDAVTPETLRDIASRPHDKRRRDATPVSRDLLDHIRLVTASALRKRGRVRDEAA